MGTNQDKFIEIFGIDAWMQMIVHSGLADQFKEYWTSYKELKDQKIDITRCLLTKEDRKAYLDQGGSYDSIVDYNSVLQRPEIY